MQNHLVVQAKMAARITCRNRGVDCNADIEVGGASITTAWRSRVTVAERPGAAPGVGAGRGAKTIADLAS